MTKAQFDKALAKSGASQDLQSLDAGNIQVDAPLGKVFASNGCHTIVEPYSNNGGQSWKPEAYAEVARCLAMGLYDCDDDECEQCYPEVTT
jgi:hypothetical protein